MSWKSRLLFKASLCCALAAVPLLGGIRSARADSLTIDSTASSFSFGIDLGQYADQMDPNTFFTVLSAIGQADPGASLLPPPLGLAVGNVPNGVVPGYSTGLSAQANGTVQATPGGFSLDAGSNIGLLDSGLWQPGTAPDGTGLPTPGEIGAYILGALNNPNDTLIVVRMDAVSLGLTTSGPLSLGPGGAFTDPSATFTLNTATLSGYASTPLGSGLIAPAAQGPISQTTALSGTYTGGVLTVPVSTYIDIPLDNVLPGLVARVTVNGTVVTTPVPEPSTITLMAFAMIGMGCYGFRRIRK